MESNARIFYNELPEVYEKLLLFCTSNGFKVKEKEDKFYLINAEKSSFLFWKNLRMELEILAFEKTQTKVTSKIYTYWKRRYKLEQKYIMDIEKYILAN
jgi:hypothetical protein